MENMTGDADVADESSTPRGGTLGVSPVVPTYPIRNNAGVSIEVLEYQRRMHAISLNLYSNSDKESKEFGDEKKKKKEIWPKWLSSYRNRQQRGKSTETRKLIIASLGTLSFWFWSSCLFNVTPGGGICTSLIPSIDLRRDGSSNWGGSPPPTQQAEQVPDFVMEYAPYVYLYSGETFWPCNIGEHLNHVTPFLNFTPIPTPPPRPSLDDLSNLNEYGKHVYLTSEDDPMTDPDWLTGESNIPVNDGNQTTGSGNSTNDDWGKSNAKSVVLWIDKGVVDLDERWAIVGDDHHVEEKGELGEDSYHYGARNSTPVRRGRVIDAFYFYFYSFNLGNMVLGVRFGNHVGDWEHTMLRFVDGIPQAMFFSEHQMGVSLEYHATEKIGKRPITYAAKGSHANYPSPGVHKYILPFGMLRDYTDAGVLWDPIKNSYMYKYNHTDSTLLPNPAPDESTSPSPVSPTDWFHFKGRWGDRRYPMSDKRQYGFWGQWHFVDGPQGPWAKRLGRRGVCENEEVCKVRADLEEWKWGREAESVEEDLRALGWKNEDLRALG